MANDWLAWEDREDITLIRVTLPEGAADDHEDAYTVTSSADALGGAKRRELTRDEINQSDGQYTNNYIKWLIPAVNLPVGTNGIIIPQMHDRIVDDEMVEYSLVQIMKGNHPNGTTYHCICTVERE
jgi:hypothetical protein